MFTSVDSNRKKLEHPSNENVLFHQSLNNSIIKESKSGIADQIDHLLSQNDEYTKLQLTIFVITFIVSIWLAMPDLLSLLIELFRDWGNWTFSLEGCSSFFLFESTDVNIV